MNIKILLFILSFSSFSNLIVKSQEIKGRSNSQSLNISKIKDGKLPRLVIDNFLFKDNNLNDRLEANESAVITFNVINEGEGRARNLKLEVEPTSKTEGVDLVFTDYIGDLNAGESKEITIWVSSNMNLETGLMKMNILLTEANGFDSDLINLSFRTLEFQSPNLEIVDFVFSSSSGKDIIGEICDLQFVIQNTGQGIAENISINMKIPNNAGFVEDSKFTITQLSPGDEKTFNSRFYTTKKFNSSVLNITAEIEEKYKKYSHNKVMSLVLGQEISNVITQNVVSLSPNQSVDITRYSLSSLIDKNIPVNRKKSKRFALVIGNEDYSSHQMDLKSEQNVDYAVNDARIFKEYALKSMGVIEENLIFIQNATSGVMSKEIKVIIARTKLEGPNAELIIYYAGHGFPDENSHVPHLIPVDVSGSDLSRAINLQDLYLDLGGLEANVTVFLDACFTGGGRESGLMASRGVKVKAKQGTLNGNLVVFSASSGDQSSLPFEAEKHGIFTYHLLKAIQDANGDISYGDLFDAIKLEVNRTSLKNQGLNQTPQVNTSYSVNNSWKIWKL